MSRVKRERPAASVRRVGYAVAALVNAALLLAVNGWPGWASVPFLTADTALVIGLVNASLVVSLAVNAGYLVHDPTWLRAFGALLTMSVGLAALVRIWQVFPLDLPAGSFDWPLAARVLLVVAMVGSVIGLVAGLAALVRHVATHHPVMR